MFIYLLPTREYILLKSGIFKLFYVCRIPSLCNSNRIFLVLDIQYQRSTRVPVPSTFPIITGADLEMRLSTGAEYEAL